MTLTKSDKKWITSVLQDTVDGQEVKFENKIDEVKNDFFNKIDPILKEVLLNQEEGTILSHKVSGHEDRIENIENKLNIASAF